MFLIKNCCAVLPIQSVLSLLCFLGGAVKEQNKRNRGTQSKLSLMDLIAALPQTSKYTSPAVLSVAQQIFSQNIPKMELN